MRTPKPLLIFRATAIVFIVYLLLAYVWFSVTLKNIWKPLEIANTAVLTVILFGELAWAVTSLVTNLGHPQRTTHESWNAPAWSTSLNDMKFPFELNSQLVTSTASPPQKPPIQARKQQPASPTFQPPLDWKFECPVCYARQPARICVCWNCNYGADGDSTAYFEKHGYAKPDDVSAAEWARIKRRQRRR